jgi:DNA-directed RNA polymerase subunit RPC12/RpoP
MADEFVVLVCGKCGTKLKIKSGVARSLKEITCVKCGTKVPTKQESPVKTDSVPIPVSTSRERPNAPAAEGSAPIASPPPAAAPSDINDLPKARGRIKELEERVTGLLAQAAQLGIAKQRIAELEVKASASTVNADTARMQHELHEQSERISELQQLWMQKEKETREAHDRAEKANRDRLDAVAERERTLSAIREVLTSYHVSEIEGAKKRMTELDQRIQQFLAVARTPGPSS